MKDNSDILFTKNNLFDFAYLMIWGSIWFAGFTSMFDPIHPYITLRYFETTVWGLLFLGITILGTKMFDEKTIKYKQLTID